MTKINEIFENKKKLPPNAAEESSPQQEVVTNKKEIKSAPNETGEPSNQFLVLNKKSHMRCGKKKKDVFANSSHNRQQDRYQHINIVDSPY